MSFPVIPLSRLDLVFADQPWPFAVERRAEIDAYFDILRRTRPSLWNGRVLLMHDYAIEGDVLRGAYLETDFASFIAWRDWGFPDATIWNGFALGALQGNDGGFVCGVMAEHTSNAGKIYFPGGTPDPDDRHDGIVDLELSVRREVEEETGIGADAVLDSGWTAVLAGPQIALMKVMRVPDTSDAIRQHIRAHIAGSASAELSDAWIVRSEADLHPAMWDFMTAFLRDHFRGLAKHTDTR